METTRLVKAAIQKMASYTFKITHKAQFSRSLTHISFQLSDVLSVCCCFD